MSMLDNAARQFEVSTLDVLKRRWNALSTAPSMIARCHQQTERLVH